MVTKFVDADADYLAWIEAHPNGFVVNAYRVPTAHYLIIHRASCGTISGTPARGDRWTTEYCKACSLDVGALQDWAKRRTGGELHPCGLCKAKAHELFA
jgi:hypothetical protein